jgi:hypothetical protein
MKNALFHLLLLLSFAGANGQQKEDLTADAGGRFSSSATKNLVLFIGTDHISGLNESVEKDSLNTVSETIKYSGLQFLYLQNRTVFSDPVSKKLPIEIISQTKNKLVFRIPKIRENILEVDLGSVRESVNQIGVQVATISFQ